MPANVLALARVFLAAGAARNQQAFDETLVRVVSGRVIREAGAQRAFIALLCEHGARPEGVMPAALARCNWDAEQALLQAGVPLDLRVAAALGDEAGLAAQVGAATPDMLQQALALAANGERPGATRLLLEHGADPCRYNPPGGHSHCTPLHSAVWTWHIETVEVLVERGA